MSQLFRIVFAIWSKWSTNLNCKENQICQKLSNILKLSTGVKKVAQQVETIEKVS